MLCLDMDTLIMCNASTTNDDWSFCGILENFEAFIFSATADFASTNFAFDREALKFIGLHVEKSLFELDLRLNESVLPLGKPIVLYDKMIHEIYRKIVREYFLRRYEQLPNFSISSYTRVKWGSSRFVSLSSISQDLSYTANDKKKTPSSRTEKRAATTTTTILYNAESIKSSSVRAIFMVKFANELRSTASTFSVSIDPAYDLTYVFMRKPVIFYSYAFLTKLDASMFTEYCYHRYIFNVFNLIKRYVNPAFVLVRLYFNTYINIYHWFTIATLAIRPYLLQINLTDNKNETTKTEDSGNSSVVLATATAMKQENIPSDHWANSLERVSAHLMKDKMVFFHKIPNSKTFVSFVVDESIEQYFKKMSKIRLDVGDRTSNNKEYGDNDFESVLSESFRTLLRDRRDVFVSQKLYRRLLDLKFLFREHFVKLENCNTFNEESFVIL